MRSRCDHVFNGACVECATKLYARIEAAEAKLAEVEARVLTAVTCEECYRAGINRAAKFVEDNAWTRDGLVSGLRHFAREASPPSHAEARAEALAKALVANAVGFTDERPCWCLKWPLLKGQSHCPECEQATAALAAWRDKP